MNLRKDHYRKKKKKKENLAPALKAQIRTHACQSPERPRSGGVDYGSGQTRFGLRVRNLMLSSSGEVATNSVWGTRLILCARFKAGFLCTPPRMSRLLIFFLFLRTMKNNKTHVGLWGLLIPTRLSVVSCCQRRDQAVNL